MNYSLSKLLIYNYAYKGITYNSIECSWDVNMLIYYNDLMPRGGSIFNGPVVISHLARLARGESPLDLTQEYIDKSGRGT